jgi:hypothetical protein
MRWELHGKAVFFSRVSESTMQLTNNGYAIGWIKLDLLSHGIAVDDSLHAFMAERDGVARRKNVYNSPTWQIDPSHLPQEIRVHGCTVGLNSYGDSPWRLGCQPGSQSLVLTHASGIQYPVELIDDLRAFVSVPGMAEVANLYGGAALAFFSPRTCYFFSDRTECGFCSLAGTADENHSFRDLLFPRDVELAVGCTLENDPGRIEQVMIVGGNIRDLDRGFKHHVELAKAAATVLSRGNHLRTVSIHIATMPPRNLDLLNMLSEFDNLHVMFNLEVWDANLFSSTCPGKQKDYGRDGLLRALEQLRDVIGAYRAHSLLVTGLDDPQSTVEGIISLASMGISPIINIYHSDRFSRLGLCARPTFKALATVADGLQDAYTHFPIEPYWRNCGRNSIDAEAKQGLFRATVPDFLTTNVAIR